MNVMDLDAFLATVRRSLPGEQIYTEPIYRLAKGTDAGFYRLIPKAVVQVNDEKEAAAVIRAAGEHGVPITFRAGGTSLSGQTITDSVVVELGRFYNKHEISDDGSLARFQAGVRGGMANALLAKHGRKIGPSPASIAAAKISGIVCNNASGSSYGIVTNSYNTVRGMRLVLADGSSLVTDDPVSRRSFLSGHKELADKIAEIRKDVLDRPDLVEKIRHKYRLKNTTGYGLNSLIDFEDPVDIIAHLMVGSEGTLGFVSEVTFETVPDNPLKAAAMCYLPSLREACKAIIPLRGCAEVSAAELMDRNSLRAVEDVEGMPALLKELPEGAAALLIDTSAATQEQLDRQIEEIRGALAGIETLHPVSFTTDPKEYANYWKVRKGLLTSGAAARPKGTACIIEDIAFSGEVLGDALEDVMALTEKYGYKGTIMWGHLLDGNVHFLVMPDFKNPNGTRLYHDFMYELVDVTVNKYDGSLKAEHGTGRNMAPFVETEWGSELYAVMKRIKAALDPRGILNPGVLLNDDKEVLVRDLKPIPVVNDLIDNCIECGFCEPNCPSRDLTLTPRQRIVVYRYLHSMRARGEHGTPEYRELAKAYRYAGEETCATDGLCSLACPVKIHTGKLVKELRFDMHSDSDNRTASGMARHLGGLTALASYGLRVPYALGSVVGMKTMESLARGAYRLFKGKFPLWTRYVPTGTPSYDYRSDREITGQREVVYFPTCINRSLGVSSDYDEKIALVKKTEDFLHKAGFRVIYPEGLKGLCCGMAFDSKGFFEQGLQKAKELEAALLRASDNGRIPVFCDMSPCLHRMKEVMSPALKLYEPVEFILKYTTDTLDFHQLPVRVAVHSTCTNTKMGLTDDLYRLASMCAEEVVVPKGVSCCAWAGDRGFFYPELNRSALTPLREEVEGVEGGYSTSRTCEIGLSMHSGVSYKSIVYLVDKATTVKERNANF